MTSFLYAIHTSLNPLNYSANPISYVSCQSSTKLTESELGSLTGTTQQILEPCRGHAVSRFHSYRHTRLSRRCGVHLVGILVALCPLRLSRSPLAASSRRPSVYIFGRQTFVSLLFGLPLSYRPSLRWGLRFSFLLFLETGQLAVPNRREPVYNPVSCPFFRLAVFTASTIYRSPHTSHAHPLPLPVKVLLDGDLD